MDRSGRETDETIATSEVCDYSFTYQGTRYMLVDTPGFNDTFESDDTITNNILRWLESSYRSGAKLNGILYLHTIAAPKMAGSAFDNLCMFRKLCGEGALKHVVLATTFWGTTDPVIEVQRETALTQDKKLWGRMIDAGSKVVRLDNNRASALKALKKVAGASKVILHAQQEMVDNGKAPKDTLAAQFIASCEKDMAANEYRERLKKRRDETMERMEKLKKMREEMEAQDEMLSNLANLATEVENAQALNSSPSQGDQTRNCRCKLVGKATCVKCGKSVGRTFYRTSQTTVF